MDRSELGERARLAYAALTLNADLVSCDERARLEKAWNEAHAGWLAAPPQTLPNGTTQDGGKGPANAWVEFNRAAAAAGAGKDNQEKPIE